MSDITITRMKPLPRLDQLLAFRSRPATRPTLRVEGNATWLEPVITRARAPWRRRVRTEC